MNLELFSTNLQNIGKVRHGVDEFHKIASEIQKDEAQVKALEAHLEKCNGIRTELDLERRNHAEELRQINQDINTLEDITKSSKTELENRKRKISAAMTAVERMRGVLNDNLEAMSIEHKLEPSEEELRFQETSWDGVIKLWK
uniref:Uncharacterized protein n=1 Tax=Caenorhabditis japonica TaxID=281687 RepID=A0A8R1ELU5_CAEJA